MKRRSADAAKEAVYLGLSSLLLFLGFFANLWQVADQRWFDRQNYPMESHIVGRLVKSRQDGVLSASGLTGVGSVDAVETVPLEPETYAHQYAAYLGHLEFHSFSTYQSQIGGQAMLFGVLDGLLPLAPETKLRVFRGLASALSALTMAMIVLWFRRESGTLASLCVLASMLLSPWLTVFGGKLWWATWAFYLPVVTVMYYLRGRHENHRHSFLFGIIVFATVFAKCVFNGYEYITTTLIMTVVPLIFYRVRRHSSNRKLVADLVTVVTASGLAILLSAAILSFQIASVEGSLADGINHIVKSLVKRTYADPSGFPAAYADSLEAGVTAVLLTYVEGEVCQRGCFTSLPFVSRAIGTIRYWHVLLLFGVASIILVILGVRRRETEGWRQRGALVSATWFSLLAPLSWFVIFKAHSSIHTHMNYVVWSMPLTLFGSAVCGRLVRSLPTRTAE